MCSVFLLGGVAVLVAGRAVASAALAFPAALPGDPHHRQCKQDSQHQQGDDTAYSDHKKDLSFERIPAPVYTICPRRGTEGNFYYRFDIREWKQLNRPIEAKETGFVRDFTNLFLLEHSVQTPELWLRTEEEYRLCSALKRAVWGDTINEPDNGLAFEFRGFTVSFAEGKIFVSDEGRTFARYELSHFLQDPGAVVRGIRRECLQRDSMRELSKI